MSAEFMLPEKMEFFDYYDRRRQALTFDDVLLANEKMNDFSSDDVDLTTRFSTNIELKIPLVSSPMDTVTESDMAIEMAKLGGLGIIHAGLSMERQAEEARKVKWNLNGFIPEPKTVSPQDTVQSALNRCDEKDWHFRTFPVVVEEADDKKKLVGMYTESDFEYSEDPSESIEVGMTPIERVVTAPVGTDYTKAYEIMRDNGKLAALPIVDDEGYLRGLFIKTDVIRQVQDNPGNYSLDPDNRLLVGIAVPTDPEEAIKRVEACWGYHDVVIPDTARGNSKWYRPTMKAVIETVMNLSRESKRVDIVAGNISHGGPARALMEAGADGLRNGQGGGSICSTRPNTGAGTPQLTADYRVAKAAYEYYKETGRRVYVCSDGGIVYPGDISLALAAGSDSVMMGRGLAATKETPGRTILENGEWKKGFRGMGSEEAIRASDARGYNKKGSGAIAPEGVSTSLTYRGPVKDIVDLNMKYLRSSFEYVGAKDIETHKRESMMDVITGSGQRESHPHDV